VGKLKPLLKGLGVLLSSDSGLKDRSIAFSGDTAPSEAVAQIAKGADVLVHEAMFVPAIDQYVKEQVAKGRPVKLEDFMAHMKADHTPVETVGHRS
jgi:ribonuclease BN (tRNA processing enzyme)